MAKLSGNTLVETLIAMVIILFCTAMGASIYMNVLSGQNSVEKMKATGIAKECISSSVSEKKFLDESFIIDELKIEKSCASYKGNKDLIDIKVVVKNNEDKVILNIEQVLLNE
ncbi:MAG: hypothetical protein ACXVNM_01210 [Bacteroidia bacterium]